MIGNEFLAREVLSHGAYLCLRRSGAEPPPRETARALDTLAVKLGLRNEFDPSPQAPRSGATRRSRAAPRS